VGLFFSSEERKGLTRRREDAKKEEAPLFFLCAFAPLRETRFYITWDDD
jgi:hypothetical protein